MPRDKLCKCGSGFKAKWYLDARGIELDLCCSKCWPEEKKKWRPEVLTDPNYEAFEDIEPD